MELTNKLVNKTLRTNVDLKTYVSIIYGMNQKNKTNAPLNKIK